MVRRFFSLLILVSIFSCSDDGKMDETPLIEGEVITEIHHINSEGVMTRRFILDHDGSRFTSYTRYDLNSEGEWQFFQSVDFSYDGQNRLIEALFFYTEDRSRAAESKFGYAWNTDSYRFNRYQLNQDNEFFIDSYEEYPYNTPENGYIEMHDFLWGFKNGNYVGGGIENQNGDLEVFGKTWSYQEHLIYDDEPNFRADQALDFTLGQRSLSNSLNSNNWIAYRFPQGNLESHTHSIVDGKIRSTTYSDGSKVEFSYVIDQL